jgi:hypothetical protein
VLVRGRYDEVPPQQDAGAFVAFAYRCEDLCAVDDAVVGRDRHLDDGRTAMASSRPTTARGVAAPTARIAAWGGLMTAAKRDAEHSEVRHALRGSHPTAAEL